jgi:acyl-coenzyme A thioesterase PaaI-like protein
MLAFDIVRRLGAISPGAANALMSHALPTIIPLTSGLGMRVVEDTRAVGTLPLKHRTRNHVGSMYFGAQMTLAEITMGMLLFRLYPPGPFGMLVKRVEADFHKKAKGNIRAVCEPGPEVLQALAAVHAEGKSEAWVPVPLTDAGGEVVTTARFLAAVKRFAPKA